MPQKFFAKPFAAVGDRKEVPNDTQITGEVSYEQGYGYDYQRDQATDPLAKPIERDKLNAILHDITEALQQYQVLGTPEWITKTDNGGKAYPYAQRARVRYRAKENDPWDIYESLADNNIAAPTNAKKWARIVSEVASQEQAIAGADNSTIMTPLRVAQATANKQSNLGYTPVQQGTGIAQQSNVVKIGWSEQGRLKATVDDTDQGNFIFDNQLANYASIDYADKHYLKPEDADNRYLTPQQGDSRYIRREELAFPKLESGHYVLPGGLILQWGYIKEPNPYGTVIEYPIAFPHAVFSLVATGADGENHGMETINVLPQGNATFKLYCSYGGDSRVSTPCFWFALGS